MEPSIYDNMTRDQIAQEIARENARRVVANRFVKQFDRGLLTVADLEAKLADIRSSHPASWA
jgi:hypothetical protein